MLCFWGAAIKSDAALAEARGAFEDFGGAASEAGEWLLTKHARFMAFRFSRRLRRSIDFIFGKSLFSARAVWAAVVIPVDPIGGGQLDLVTSAPRVLAVDQLVLEQADRRLGQRVIVRVADGADGGVDTRVLQPYGEGDRCVLLEFNLSLQHRTGGLSVAALRTLRPGCASRESCGAGC